MTLGARGCLCGRLAVLRTPAAACAIATSGPTGPVVCSIARRPRAGATPPWPINATGGERRPHKQEAQLFARRIVLTLEAARRKQEFDRLVLMAGPPFLGTLRAALRKSVRAALIAEIPKDLVHQTEREVRVHVPREIFRTSATLADHP